MKLVRPYIPIAVRLEVIARQMQRCGLLEDVLVAIAAHMTPSKRLAYLLEIMFDADEKVHLDHDPALCLREIIDAEVGKYVPDANDPRYLIYRTKEDHRVKTFIRGEGAQLSDAGKRRKELGRLRPKRPSRWPPKGSRPLQWKPR